MKNFLLLLLLLVATRGQAQTSVQARVYNFENNKGVCRVCLFASADDYKNMRARQCVLVPVVNWQAMAQFTNLQPGTYALFVFHDVNNNGKMDTNFLGIPKEGYGASQNKLPFAAAPRFDANKFTVTDGTALQLNIKLRNI